MPRGLRADHNADLVRVQLRITTPLTFRNTPLDPTIDFPELIREAGLTGAVDPNSIAVVDSATGKSIPHALTEDFAYRDRGRIEFVVAKPDRRDFEIRFCKRRLNVPALGRLKRTAPGVVCHCSWVDVACLGLA